MLHHERLPAPSRALVVLAAALLACSLIVPARAADTRADSKPDTSLSLIPADAAFYGSMLRNREQLDAVAKSKTWARITALPLYKLAVKRLQQEYTEDEGKLASLRKWLEQEDNKDLVALLGDAFSEEVFFYGGPTWVGFMDLMAQLNTANRFGPLLLVLNNPGQTPSPQARARSLLHVLNQNRDKIKTPDLVIGFKIKDPRKAEAQIKRLETLLQLLVMQQPMLQGRLKRAKVGSGSFLTLALDGDMVPWEQIPWNQVEEKEGEFDDLLKSLRKLKLTISLGVRDNFLLFSIGSTNEGLRQLGGEGPRLVSRPELKPVLQAADKRLTDIGYVSKDLHGAATMTREDVNDLAQMTRELLQAAEVPAEKRKPIEKDIADLIKELKPHLPVPGASVSFTYLTERGCESYVYEHGTFPDRDATQPLSLLQHVGGDPILAVVGRSKSKGGAENYRRMSKWVRTFYGHVEPLILDKLEDEQKEKFDKVRKAAVPLLERLDEVTGSMLVPALADGQAGFVLDARWKSKQWHPSMELGDKPLPMPELGLVLGVSDADLLEKAMKSYRKILNDTLTVIREQGGEGVPEMKLPPPEVKTVKAGKLFVFALPADWKLDPQVAPTAGLSSKVAVVTLSASHAERLLTPRPLVVEGGPLADAKKPMAGASYFSCPALIDALTPWAMLAVDHWQEQLKEALASVDDDKKASEDLAGQVRTLLHALKVFHATTSVTTLEDGVLVTHSETLIRDR